MDNFGFPGLGQDHVVRARLDDEREGFRVIPPVKQEPGRIRLPWIFVRPAMILVTQADQVGQAVVPLRVTAATETSRNTMMHGCCQTETAKALAIVPFPDSQLGLAPPFLIHYFVPLMSFVVPLECSGWAT